MYGDLRSLTTILVFVAALAVGSVVQATPPCECAEIYSTPWEDEGVPTNGRIMIADPNMLEMDTLRLRKMLTEDTLEFQVEETDGGPTWLTPSSELEGDAKYEVFGTFSNPDFSGDYVLSFRTASGPDSTAPTFDQVTIKGDGMAGACGAHTGASVTLTNIVDDTTAIDDLVLRIRVTDPNGNQSIVYAQGYGWDGALLTHIGTGQPNCLDNYSAAVPGQSFTAVVSLMDWAGNESTASPEMEFQFVEAAGVGGNDCGCSLAAPAGTPPAWWLVMSVALLVGVVVGRRA